jgi:hypothetical protein
MKPDKYIAFVDDSKMDENLDPETLFTDEEMNVWAVRARNAMRTYQEIITMVAESMGRPDVDPRHIEGYMRVEHSTLDGLSSRQFRNEVEIGIACVDADGPINAERNAQSFGL